jgi:hypothetical protein
MQYFGRKLRTDNLRKESSEKGLRVTLSIRGDPESRLLGIEMCVKKAEPFDPAFALLLFGYRFTF